MTKRELSRKEFIINYQSDGLLSNDEIQIGCLQRIADATELMARSHAELQTNLDMYKRWYSIELGNVRERDKTIISMRGQITKLKNRLAKQNAEQGV